MYKPLPVEGGWLVFYIEEDKPPRPADGRTKPYPHKRPADGRTKPYPHKTHAYRRARKLNKALEEVEQMIKRDGAIIL